MQPQRQSWRNGNFKPTRWIVLGICILTLGAYLFVFPETYNTAVGWIKNRSGFALPAIKTITPFVLGLDLQGGAHLVYEADTKKIAESDVVDAIEGVRDVIERRINSLGVSEPIIQTNNAADAWRVIVELPGIKDVKLALKAIGETPVLEFREESSAPPRPLIIEEKENLKKINEQQLNRTKELLALIQKGESFENIAKANSENATKESAGKVGFVKEEGTYKEIVRAIKNDKVNETHGQVIENLEGFHIVKLNQKENDEVSASHILICIKGLPGCTSERSENDARAQAEELYSRLTPTNFAELAKQYSDDKGSGGQGGDLGFFGRGQMVKEFEDQAYTLKVGTISLPFKSAFGYHLLHKKTIRPLPQYDISEIFIKKTTEIDILPARDKWVSTGLTGRQLSRAQLDFDPNSGAPLVSLEFNDEGRELFAQITKRNLNKAVAIYLDGQPISIPTVSVEIPDGKAIIEGNFTVATAKILAGRLNAGALPVPITLVSQTTVGASLGERTLERSVGAGIIGFLCVAIFIILYYRAPGIVSVFSLVLYALLTLALFKIIPVTLTAASIAGFVLSVGMAIDANVLIFERLKEELQAGRALSEALEEAFTRAWFSIRASNVSSLITAGILMTLSTSVVRGFAVTLSLGILMSMFSAVVVTRILMRLVIARAPKTALFFLGAGSNGGKS